MSAIKERKDKSGLFTLRVNPNDYYSNEALTPKNNLRRVISAIDNTNPVMVDSARIMSCFHGLRAKDHKYYFYMLSQLERNDKPITVNMGNMREFTQDRLIEAVWQGLDRLVAQGLLFRVPLRKATFLVNPVYAWKGNRLDYLDTDSLPLDQG